MQISELIQRLEHSKFLIAHATEDVGHNRARQLAVVLHEVERRHGDSNGARCYFIPGRIELFGKHTDYIGGESLVCATSRGIAAVSLPNDRPEIDITDLSAHRKFVLPLDGSSDDSAHWGLYPETVFHRLKRDSGSSFTGQSIYFSNSLPRSSGLSSSSALVTMLAIALIEHNGLMASLSSFISDKHALAEYFGSIENGLAFESSTATAGVGTKGGCQDHAAILLGQEASVLHLGFQPLETIKSLEWPRDWKLAVGVSGVHARKSGDQKEEYNSAVHLAKDCFKLIGDTQGISEATLGELIRSPKSLSEIARFLEIEAEDLSRRFSQAHREIREYIPKALASIELKDQVLLSEASGGSHDAANRLLMNQITETNVLVSSAMRAGAFGASAFGAGYGGAVWAAFEETALGRGMQKWEANFNYRYPEHMSSFFFERPSRGAIALHPDSIIS